MIATCLLKVGVGVGVLNFLAILLHTEMWGEATVNTHWYGISLIATFPVGLFCAWELCNRLAIAKWMRE
ncbi:hypothetical protein [Rhizomicrobium electricum]|uniref:Uncharacterized protein n=1 Tax=Rhizomicrobium electricum TaxID=480070 RepID=A0ABN1E8Z0_9PROT|nr:hypothetical protein [Rhizomicrobium electricum]NIJ47965.1 hypothetical protein [Rhizomicrobium electricum]